MYSNITDTRKRLNVNDIVEITPEHRYIIDAYLACGGFCLMYLAHREGSSRYVALKELFPRSLEYSIAERDEKGKIRIFDPLAQDSSSDNDEMWNELSRYFDREVSLTKKAGEVFDESGKKVNQNNPDVLSIEGPFKDANGNIYLAVDTFHGQSFRQIIESGFIKNEQNNVEFNSRLDDVLEILTKVTLRLSKLHADNHILHLDLSPDNIYVTKVDADTSLTPHIIDYGSSYDMDDKSEPLSHRYTCNPHSAPEVSALAEINCLGCGYETDKSSDTYSIVSILFYAVTGMIYTSDLRMFDAEWKKLIRDGYPKELHFSDNGKSLADMMIDIFDKGLSSQQTERYTTADELYHELVQLKDTYQKRGNILSLLDPDELISYAILDKYPLYNYKSSDGNLNVLCLGSGEFNRRMILSLISVGQMLDSHLNIHIVSSEPESTFRCFITQRAPELYKYSNLDPEKCLPECEYVTFSYERVSDLFDDETLKATTSKYKSSRYVIISMGTNAKNAKMAYSYGETLASLSSKSDGRAIIHYYMSEDAAGNTRTDAEQIEAPEWLQIKAFGNTLSSYFKTIRTLGQRTLKTSYLYDKLGDPRHAIEDTAKKFINDEYGQRNSCTSALHLKYKLASIGISPKTNTKAIISGYLKKIKTRSGDLMYLEHRRWIMAMIADGYTGMSRTDLLNYGFTMEGDSFNDNWKSKAHKKHHCLVPCGKGEILLDYLSHDENGWDKYKSDAEIDAADYDELDKMSLKVHLLAKEKCRQILKYHRIDIIFDDIGERLSLTQNEVSNSRDKSESFCENLEKAQKAYDACHADILAQASDLKYCGKVDLSILETAFSSIGIDISGAVNELKQLLSVFIEYSKYRDYKAPDKTFIDNLLWILYADNDISLIKLSGRSVSDNIIASLLINPRSVTYFGAEIIEIDKYECFFKNQGLHAKTNSIRSSGSSIDEICSELEYCVSGQNGNCVLDITGANEAFVCAAMKLSSKMKEPFPIIRAVSDPPHIEEISEFAVAPAYSLTPKLSADDVFGLYGAVSLKNSNYMLQLSTYIPALWKLYQKHHSKWESINSFFANRGNITNELYFHDIKPTQEWCDYRNTIDKRLWNAFNFYDVFHAMEQKGFIRDFSVANNPANEIKEYLISFQNIKIPFIKKAFDGFFIKAANVSNNFVYSIEYDQNTGYKIVVDSGTQVYYTDKTDYDFSEKRNIDKKGTRTKYADIFPVLEDFAKEHLILNNKCRLDPSHLEKGVEVSDGTALVSFSYANSSVKDCLLTAGSVLEVYLWDVATREGYFDDVKPNFYFQWESGITNELDVILTKGMKSLFVSCKTAKFKKEHLYEICALTNQFSVNSKPVIVYSSKLAYDDETGKIVTDLGPVKERARSMGVYLIDLNEPGIDLGKKLINIIENTDQL